MPALRPGPRAAAVGILVTRLRLALRRRPVAWWLAVLGLAALTAATAARVSAEADAALARYGHTRPVLVARVDLPAGVPLPADAVLTESRPVGLVPADALDALPVGAVTRAPVAAGEAVLGRRVDPTGASPLAASLPTGTRGVAVPRSDTVPDLVPGDRVDVLVAAPGLDPGAATSSTAARAATVVDVGELAVLLAVDAPDVGAVSAAAGAGLVALVLVPAGG